MAQRSTSCSNFGSSPRAWCTTWCLEKSGSSSTSFNLCPTSSISLRSSRVSGVSRSATMRFLLAVRAISFASTAASSSASSAFLGGLASTSPTAPVPRLPLPVARQCGTLETIGYPALSASWLCGHNRGFFNFRTPGPGGVPVIEPRSGSGSIWASSRRLQAAACAFATASSCTWSVPKVGSGITS